MLYFIIDFVYLKNVYITTNDSFNIKISINKNRQCNKVI